MASIRAKINPQVLAWARSTSGLSLEVAARKIGGSKFLPSRLADWESGTSFPTVVQLRKIARVYRRPIAAFFFSAIPRDFSIPKDFRRLSSRGQDRVSPELRLQIRLAEERREYALEIYDDLGERPVEGLINISTAENASSIARDIRAALGVSIAVQKSWQDPQNYTALRNWRSSIEALGILVLQFINVQPQEAMGFSIGKAPLPVIAINRYVYPAGRIFTLMHELTHVLLREGGICELDDSWTESADTVEVETLCNVVAGEILVPLDSLLSEPEILVTKGDGLQEVADEQLAALSARYSVSQEVILRRLLSSQIVSASFYSKKRAQFQAGLEVALRARTAATIAARAAGKEFLRNPAREATSLLGTTFVRLVLEDYRQGHITLSDVSSYLGIRVRHVPTVQELVLAS